jgi:hypothetical protein
MREVWANYFLPQDRARVIEQLADLPKQVPDETARIDLAAFTAALQASPSISNSYLRTIEPSRGAD